MAELNAICRKTGIHDLKKLKLKYDENEDIRNSFKLMVYLSPNAF
jgi:hypothetical protein